MKKKYKYSGGMILMNESYRRKILSKWVFFKFGNKKEYEKLKKKRFVYE